MLRRMVGKHAPNFEMDAIVPVNKFTKVNLEDLKKADKWVILFFYPMDFSPICSTEIVAMADRYEEFVELNTEIIAISTDTIYTHEVWINTPIEENGVGLLSFPLAADTNHVVSKEFGVLVEEKGVAQRGIFIINPNGEIQYQSITHDNVGRDVDETLRVLQALQTDKQCPANWKPGQKTL